MRSLKILFSAYACEPGKGSEPGVGWRWALETARLGHDVWVITRSNNHDGITQGLSDLGHPSGLHFVYFDFPYWARWWKRGARGIHLYYVLWQWGAYLRARQLHATHRFDAVHQITFGVIRHASFMGRLGIPFVLGPLGGGERAPLRLRKHFPLRGQIKDALRDCANALARLDPYVRQMLQSAALILLKTPDSMAWLPKRYRQKARCMLEIGIDLTTAENRGQRKAYGERAELRLVYVGRFIYLKGMVLGMRAVALARARGIPVTLTLVGHGPELKRWKALARSLGIDQAITWSPWMRQHDLLAAYGSFDALLFPSLHDSSGNVVLEAISNGLPVICLDLGGPAQIVTNTCGRVIPVSGRREPDLVAAMAQVFADFWNDADLMASLHEGALSHSRRYQWSRVVSEIWGPQGAGCLAVSAHYASATGVTSLGSLSE